MKKETPLEIPESIEEILRSINDDVIEVIAVRLKDIGKLSQEELAQTLSLITYYNEDMANITKLVANKTEFVEKEIERMLINSIDNAQADVSEFYKLVGSKAIPYSENKALQSLVRATKEKMLGDLLNLSQTTGNIGIIVDGKVVSLRQGYLNLINKGTFAVKTGAIDYNTAINKAVQELGKGVRVIYPSGRTMRIDSAVRMNILDGARQMTMEVRREEGKRFGANGVYIMPHGLCAKDHLDYQGQEFTYEQLNQLNEKLERPIGTGEMNCRHTAIDIIVGEGEHPYSKEELNDIRKYSNEQVKWNEKSMTRYEASQEQRKAETHIRDLKLRLESVKASGDTLSELTVKKNLDKAKKQYRKDSKAVGLRPKYSRL